MIYIKLDNDMCLSVTNYEPIHRGDNLNRRIYFLIPLVIGDMDTLASAVYLSYIRADGTADYTTEEDGGEVQRAVLPVHAPCDI